MGYFGIPGVHDNTEGLEYKKPVPIDQYLQGRDSTPKEVVDLRSQFFAQEGLKKTVRVPFEDGTFVAKPNTSLINRSDEPIISFYPDNTEYNVANMQNLNDLALINQTFTTVAGAGAALAGARPQTQHVVLNKPGTKVIFSSFIFCDSASKINNTYPPAEHSSIWFKSDEGNSNGASSSESFFVFLGTL